MMREQWKELIKNGGEIQVPETRAAVRRAIKVHKTLRLKVPKTPITPKAVTNSRFTPHDSWKVFEHITITEPGQH